MSGGKNRTNVVAQLVVLIDELAPFLDSFGRAYCRMPHAEKDKQGILPLRDRQVRALLSYRYHKEHGDYPGRERIAEASEYVEGRLLEHRKGPVVQNDDPVLRCLVQAARETESWAGSAQQLLNLLREVKKQSRLKGKFPRSADALGIWLSKNHQLLLAQGIELYRPSRRARERLWGWRRIIIDGDTSDTSTGQVSPEASLPNSTAHLDPMVEYRNAFGS
jgi:hypothetical protein